MKELTNVINYFSKYNMETIIDIIIGVAIIIWFKILSTGIANIITKIFKPNIKKADRKKSKMYLIVKKTMKYLGLYLAVVFLKNPLYISEPVFLLIKKLFTIIFIFMIAAFIAECISLDGIRKISNKSEDDGMSNFIAKIIKGVIYIVAAFIAILELGYDLSGLVTGLGIGSVVITLAAQNLAKDILGGLVIFTDKPFKVGDWIQFEDYEGTVEDITYRSTRIRTFENSIVNVPNALISNASLINCSRIEKRRYKINLGIELGTPLTKLKVIEEKIRTMLKEKENVMDDSIIVKFDKITDNAMNLLIYAFTDSVDYTSFLTEKEEINYKIIQILDSENVELAYDTKTVYIKQ